MIVVTMAEATITNEHAARSGIITGEAREVKEKLAARGFELAQWNGMDGEIWDREKERASVTFKVHRTEPGKRALVERVADRIVQRKMDKGMSQEEILAETDYEVSTHKDFFPAAFKQAYENAAVSLGEL